MARLFLAFTLLLLPATIYANSFKDAIPFLPKNVTYYEAPSQKTNLDNVKLLSSRTNSDPKAALGGGDIIIDNDALVASGPFGEKDYNNQYSAGEISVYTVREGDSLSQIADMFDVTTNTIMWANDMDSATITPGQELVILPIVGVRHVVKEGDTINSIAKKYDGDSTEILAYNQLSSEASLSAGQTLIIPGGNVHRETRSKPTRSSTKKVAKTNSGGSSSGGGFTHPVPGAIKTQGIHGYNAVDLGAPAGTPIRAAASGEVIVSRSGGWNGGYGNYLVIKHDNGTQTLYSHNSSNAVGVGAYVEAGQTIGYVGSTGRSTGDHLHFEVRGASNPF